MHSKFWTKIDNIFLKVRNFATKVGQKVEKCGHPNRALYEKRRVNGEVRDYLAKTGFVVQKGCVGDAG